MAPFRAARSTRSGRQGVQADFDIIDGLPIRHWHLQEAPVGVESSVEAIADQAAAIEPTSASQGTAWPELSMPRASGLYASWCQQLLRAARAGRIQKRKRDHDGEEERDDADEHGAGDDLKQGFMASRWVPVPRQDEPPEPDFLAQRRTGLSKAHAGFINGVATDQVDSLVVDVPEEPVRRRNPPPRRKPKKGPGRKKKIAFTGGEGESAAADDSLLGTNQQGSKKPADGQDGAAKEEADDDDEEGDDDDDESEDGAGPEAATNDQAAHTSQPDQKPAPIKEESTVVNDLPEAQTTPASSLPAVQEAGAPLADAPSADMPMPDAQENGQGVAHSEVTIPAEPIVAEKVEEPLVPQNGAENGDVVPPIDKQDPGTVLPKSEDPVPDVAMADTEKLDEKVGDVVGDASASNDQQMEDPVAPTTEIKQDDGANGDGEGENAQKEPGPG